MAMDVMRVYVIMCDHPGCGACGDDWVPAKHTRRKADEARAANHRWGWVTADGKDYCPEHAPGHAA